MAYSTERRAAVLKKLEPPNAVPLRQLAKDEGFPRQRCTPGAETPAARGGSCPMPTPARRLDVARQVRRGHRDRRPERGRSRRLLPPARPLRRADPGLAGRLRAGERLGARQHPAAGPGDQGGKEAHQGPRAGPGTQREGAGRGGGAAGAAKKRRGDLGGRRGRMISTPDRQNAIALIDQAKAAGARRARPVRNSGSTRAPVGAGEPGTTYRRIAARRRLGRHPATRCRRRNARPCWTSATARPSRACRPARSCPASQTRAAISRPKPASTASCGPRGSSTIAAGPSRRRVANRRPATAPAAPARSGAGTSPGCRVQSGACSSTST